MTIRREESAAAEPAEHSHCSSIFYGQKDALQLDQQSTSLLGPVHRLAFPFGSFFRLHLQHSMTASLYSLLLLLCGCERWNSSALESSSADGFGRRHFQMQILVVRSAGEQALLCIINVHNTVPSAGQSLCKSIFPLCWHPCDAVLLTHHRWLCTRRTSQRNR